MLKKTFIFIFILSFSFSGYTQKKTALSLQGDKNLAKEYFDNQNFKFALDEYMALLKTDSTNVNFLHNAAVCILNQVCDRKKSIAFLNKVVNQPKFDPNAWYDLGRAYQYNYQFDEAITAYNKFIAAAKKDINYIPALRQIEMCENAKMLMLKPLNVSFENLGNEINSSAPDYNPYVSADESFMVFSSKRNGNIGNLIDNEGFNTSDIFAAENNGSWSKPKRLAPVINSPISDDCTGLTPDGISMCIRYDNNKMLGDIMVSELKGKSFLRPMNASEVINTSAEESAACLSPDKQTMFFSSNRDGGIGGKDLYYTKRLPSGEWSQAVNLGSDINGVYDENFPCIAPDGETLYFCSYGHNSMGGYDIFKSKWDKETYTFTEPENMGYPINTPEDETTISFTKSGRYAYIAAFRNEGFGDKDIYRIIFNDIAPAFTVLSGKIITENDTLDEKSKLILNENIRITVFDKKSNTLIGKYAPNKVTNKFVIVLNPGAYILKFEAKAYNIFETEISIADKEQEFTEITKDITLTKSTQ